MIVGLFNDKPATIVCNVQLQPAIILVSMCMLCVQYGSALITVWSVVWIVINDMWSVFNTSQNLLLQIYNAIFVIIAILVMTLAFILV